MLITGASAGIGKACAIVFAEAGADLIVTARRIDRLQKIASDLESQFATRVLPIALDVRDADAVENLIANLPDHFRNIDILINNAGLVLGVAKAHETPTVDVDVMLDTNIKGVLNLIRSVVPQMINNDRGQVVNISSIAGHEAYPGGSV